MIDWFGGVVPCLHARPVHGGFFTSCDADGVMEYSVAKRLPLSGSFDTRCTLRTHRNDPRLLEVSGNVVKYFQGHNLWGSGHLVELVAAFMEDVCARYGDAFGLTPTAEDRSAWRAGEFDVSRVDTTDSYQLANLAEVLTWLRAAEQTAHLVHRGRGRLTKDGCTLAFAEGSRRSVLKLYAKAREIEKHWDKQPGLHDAPEAVAWAQGILRCELELKSMELKRLGLARGTSWCSTDGVEFDSLALLRDRLKGMTMTIRAHLSAEVLASLRPSERTAVLAWESGADLRAVLARRTFYRLRSKLLPHGIDLATLLPRDCANVVPLMRVLEAVPATVPTWAYGTPLYFEPRRAA